LSRFHWDLITLWTDYIYEDNKPKIAFGQIWHTPIAASNSKPCLLLSRNINLPTKIKINQYFKAFQAVALQVTLTNFKNKRSYFHLIGQKTIDGKTRLSTEKMSGLAFFGKNTNEIPVNILDQLI